jgi:hypothetical protein
MPLRIKKLNIKEGWRAYRLIKTALPEKLPTYNMLLVDFIYDVISKLHRSSYFNFLEIVTGMAAMDLTKKYSPIDLASAFVEGFEINRMIDLHATMLRNHNG